MASTTRSIPSATADAVVAAILLAVGSSIRGDLLFLLGLPLTLYGFAIALRGAMAARGMTGETTADQWQRRFAFWLSVAAAAGIGISTLNLPLWYEIARRTYSVAGIIVVGVWSAGPSRTSRRLVLGLLVAATFLHVLAPFALPEPLIDVWWWTETAVRALIHGVNPYLVQAPDMQNGAFNYGYDLRVYPYTPATLLAFAPAVYLFGDYRFLLAICLPATVWFVRATGRRLQTDAHLVDAVTLAILLNPRSLWFTAFGWGESLLVLIAAVFVYAFVRAPEGAGQAVAFFLLPALKQYFAVPVILYLTTKPPRPARWALVAGLAVGAATIAPFALWNPAAMLDGIVFQMRELREPRVDSDSIVAFLGAVGFAPISRWWSVVAQFVVGAVAYWRLHHLGVAGLLLASGLSLTATFLIGWQAFFNYYYLVEMLMLLGAVALAGPGGPV